MEKIAEIPGRPGYFASSDGRIWTNRPRNGKGTSVEMREVNGTVDKNGYRVIGFKEKPQRRFAHQLVLEAFVGMRNEGEVGRHLDGDQSNNNLENLTWSTQKENLGDKIAHGTDNRGSNHASSKLDEVKVEKILDLCLSGESSHTEIADVFGVSRQTIQRIAAGKRWKHVKRPS